MDKRFLETDTSCREWYERLRKIFDDVEKSGTPIRYISSKIFNVYPYILEGANTELRREFLKECEREIVECYQRSLECNYERIADHKSRGIMERSSMETWILTVDESGTPGKTRVVGINKKGYPIYADNFSAKEIFNECMSVGNYRYKLNRWLEEDGDLYKLRADAQSLREKGRLGMESAPSPNYDLDGLSGGQLDAAAWRNYEIESGMYRRTDYDDSLDGLLTAVDKCIDFYEKAMQMVE